MLKIFKIVVTGLEGQPEIGLNSTVRTTMGYDSVTKQINVLVEKVNLAEIPMDKTVELRDPHTTATFETLLEKNFTVEDFPKTSECIKWYVDYDVVKNEFVGPFNAYDLTKSNITGSQSARKVARFIKERYSQNLIPLFALDSFYKNAQDFEASVLTFYTDESGLEINDTILTGAATTAETVTQQEKEFWCVSEVNTTVYFEVLDNDGKVLSSIVPSLKPEAKSINFVDQTLMNIDPNNVLPANRNLAGNQYKVLLPVSDAYDIRVVYSRHLGDYISNGRDITSNFDITCVNGISNKSRSTSGVTTEKNDIMLSQHNAKADGQPKTFSGLDNIRISTAGLLAGDFVKLKLDLGEFKSYAELWIELV